MENLVISFTLDIIDYLGVINDYGKVNYKYFNFVWKKKGFQEIFANKNEVVINKWKAIEFVEEAIFLFKKLFLAKESQLVKAVSIFLLYKLYFTDSYAKALKIRVNYEDFAQFKAFILEIDMKPEFQPIKFMFWHLVSEGAFMFVTRSHVLGLDIYTNKTGHQQDENEQTVDSMLFWKDLKKSVNELKTCDLNELKELDELHNQAVDCIQDTEPQTNLIKPLELSLDQVIKSLGEQPKPNKANQQKLIQDFPEYFVPRAQKALLKKQKNRQKAKEDGVDEEDVPKYRKSSRKLVKKNLKESTSDEDSDQGYEITDVGNNVIQKYVMQALGASFISGDNKEDLKVLGENSD